MDPAFTVGEAVPECSVPPIPSYSQFYEVAVPSSSGASRAYRGFIRPFSDDPTARRVLRALCLSLPLSVSSGRLDSDTEGLPVHPLEEYLLEMAQPCTVLVLEFEGKRHYRSYLIDPPMTKRLSANAHLYPNRTLTLAGRETPELCVYSGNLFKYDPTADKLTQYLNQLSTYLAKHLIFLRTRMLHKLQKDGTARIFQRRNPTEPVTQGTLSLSKKFIWFGYWAGLSAPSGLIQHLRTVNPNGQCWCNSGDLYKDCHQARELGQARQLARQKAPMIRS